MLPTLTSTEGYYRSAATSPFQTVQVETVVAPGSSGSGSIVSGRSGVAFVRSMNAITHEVVVPSNAMLATTSPISEEIPRFKEDYDSDDELRRGDISFSLDGGTVDFLHYYLMNLSNVF